MTGNPDTQGFFKPRSNKTRRRRWTHGRSTTGGSGHRFVTRWTGEIITGQILQVVPSGKLTLLAIENGHFVR